MIVWLMGMSGSGKTTLAAALYEQLKPSCRHLVYLDGDTFREMFRDELDHTVEGRRKNAGRISHLCRFLDSQNLHVLCAVLSIFPEWQAWNRDNFSQYYEIFLDVPMAELEKRDTKGLYADAKAGRISNVVGVDIPFPPPPLPDLVIDLQRQAEGVEACADYILAKMPSLQ